MTTLLNFLIPSLRENLSLLRHLLSNLPLSIVPNGAEIYCFHQFPGLDAEMVDDMGSEIGALNHELEVIIGRDRAGLIVFREQGPSLTAVVDIIEQYITGSDGENILLIKWINDLIAAARATFDRANVQIPTLDVEVTTTVAHEPPSGTAAGKRKADAAAARQEDKKRAKTKRAEAVAKTSQKINHPFDDLLDIPEKEYTTGRPSNPVLARLSIACIQKSDNSKKRFRCSSVGCQQSWAGPARQTPRILGHAVEECNFISSELRQLAMDNAGDLSLGSKVAALPPIPTSKASALAGGNKGGVPSNQPSVYNITSETGRANLQKRWELSVLRLICATSAPPYMLDYQEWKDCFATANPLLKPFCSTTFSDRHVPMESAAILALSRAKLQDPKITKNLTISFDGGTLRSMESVYTVHVTTGTEPREVHLMEGNEASGESHTAEHIKGVLLRVIDDIGRAQFAGICSDSTGNTRLARDLIAKEIPSIIVLADPCHQLNLLAKDILKLDYFSTCILTMKKIIQFFRKSSFGSRHLKAARVRSDIKRGLEGIGKTRFSTFYYAGISVLRCLPSMRELIAEGVIDVKAKKSHPLYILNNASSALQFELCLSQMTAVLAPIAKATKCLEAVESTVCDVYLYWLAVMATFRDMFSSDNDNSLSLSFDLISRIRSLVNGRYREMIEGPGKEIYLTGFFLNPRYITSDVLRRHERNPLGTRIVIRRPDAAQPGENINPESPPLPPPSPDDDLRKAIPCYAKVANYLGSLLKHAIPDAPPRLFKGLNTAKDIWKEFRRQLAQYARMEHPFNKGCDENISPWQYWKNLSYHDDSKLLAHIAIKVLSLCANSMGEERTVSNFSKLNQADRGSLKAATIVGMTRIKQHYRRLQGQVKQKGKGGVPVKFRDLSEFTAPASALQSIPNTPALSSAAGDSDTTPLVIDDATDSAPDANANNEDEPPAADDADPLERLLEDLDEHNVAAFVGRRDMFAVEACCDELEGGDAVDLTDPGLLDLLSDIPVSGVTYGDEDTQAMPLAQESAGTKFQKKNFDPSSVDFSLD